MTIQTINIGTTANDGTGDAPRQAAEVVNSNFTDPDNAASKIVGTSSDQIPTANDLNMIGAINYTSNNLNKNEFGGITAFSKIAVGTSINATTAEFYLPISFKTVPSSVTIVGNFNIVRPWNNTVAGAGIVPVMGGLSSNKVLIIRATVPSGLLKDEIIFLESNSSTAQIMVNV